MPGREAHALRHFVPLAITLALAAPAAFALDPLGLQDDAGLGADAPDAWQGAAPLAGGQHTGTLSPGLDLQDWYKVGPLAGERMRLEMRAPSGSVYVQVRDDAGTLLWQGYSQGNTVRYLTGLGGSYRFGFVASESSVEPTYAFRLDLVAPPVQTDAGLPGDAGDAPGAARGVVAGSFSGLLHPFSADTRDWFSFSAPAGKRVTATLDVPAGTSANVRLASASGAVLASATASGGTASVVWGATASRILVETDGQDGIVYAVTLAYSDPPAQNDAGLGGDAPAERLGAPLLADGSYAGILEVHAADVDDSYRATAPAGHKLYASLSVLVGWARLKAFDASGNEVANVAATTSYSGSFEIPAGAYAITIGGTSDPAFTEYALHVDAVPFGRVDLLGVSVDDEAPDPDHPNIRNIRILAQNLGAGVYRDGPLLVNLYDHVGPWSATYNELLLDEDFTLAPWETKEIVVPWDTTTFVGDFDLEVVAFQSDFDNEEIWQRIHAPIDPPGPWGVGVYTGWIG